MDWYIKDVVVYGEGDQVRRVELQRGVNIITGESQSGKSALIPIVDYCLGSSEYDVPVNVIRAFARWYGIRIQTPDSQLFLARKEPGDAQSTDVMHILVGQEVEIPPLTELSGNTQRKAVIDELSRRLGMMEQPLAQSIFDKYVTEPPTIRNIAPFLSAAEPNREQGRPFLQGGRQTPRPLSSPAAHFPLRARRSERRLLSSDERLGDCSQRAESAGEAVCREAGPRKQGNRESPVPLGSGSRLGSP